MRLPKLPSQWRGPIHDDLIQMVEALYGAGMLVVGLLVLGFPVALAIRLARWLWWVAFG